jgi:arylsulfatase A-like enzyme
VAAYGQAVESAYCSMDGVLGRVLAAEPDSARLIVLSDHGFRENRDPDRASSGWHRPEGILVANGPGMRAGVALPPGSVVDVAPTVLYSLGLPVADDFDGNPALDLFTEEFRATHALTTIPSWEPETARARGEAPVASPVDDEILGRLKSLGYLD